VAGRFTSFHIIQLATVNSKGFEAGRSCDDMFATLLLRGGPCLSQRVRRIPHSDFPRWLQRKSFNSLLVLLPLSEHSSSPHAHLEERACHISRTLV
jgi:hypothetical protein